MTDYINNIAVDLDIYSKWPEQINDLALVYVPETDEHAANLIFVQGNETYPERQLHELTDFPDLNFLGRIMWRVQGENAPVVGLELDPAIQNIGVGKFLCIVCRTWVAEKFNVKIFAPEFFRTQEVEEILKQIALEYNETDLVVQTTNGEYKPFGDIVNIQEELGI